MKRWTNTWAALIVAGFLTVPAAAQTPQTTAAPTTTATATSDQAQQGTPQEHLQKADAAVFSRGATPPRRFDGRALPRSLRAARAAIETAMTADAAQLAAPHRTGRS